MSTVAAQVQFNLSARDQSAAAFASMKRNMQAVEGAARGLRQGLAAIAGGNLLASFVRSMVRVNRDVPDVAASFDILSRAWKGFALKVGEAGLNDALIGFANRIGMMVTGTDGLSQSIGRFLGGAVNVMGTVFEGIGRSIAFAYDNMEQFKSVLQIAGLVVFGKAVLSVGSAFIKFAAAMQATGKIMAAFHAIQRAGSAGFLLLAAAVGYATDSLDDMKRVIDDVWKKVKETFPQIGEIGKGMLEDLGFDLRAFGPAFQSNLDFLNNLPAITDPATTSTAKLGKAAGGAATGIKQLADAGKQSMSILQEAGQTIGSAFSTFFSTILDRTTSAKEAFGDMVKSILSNLANLAINKFFSMIFGGGMGGGGGLLSSLFSGFTGNSLYSGSFSGFFAEGGKIPAGKWGIVGENGPEPVEGPATVYPNRAMRGFSSGGRSTHVTVNIMTPDPGAFQKSAGQVRHGIARAVAAGQRYN